MIRRNFLKGFSLLSAGSLLEVPKTFAQFKGSTTNDRTYWVDIVTKISYPVLHSLSENKLKELMPVEAYPGSIEGRKKVTYLEALGRTLAGLAPWLELGADETKEGKLRKQFIDLSTSAIRNAVTPSSVNFMNFTEANQPLVDA